VSNPVEHFIDINFPSSMVGQEAVFKWYDQIGRNIQSSEGSITSQQVTHSTPSIPGLYIFRIQINSGQYSFRIVKN
jgi:hypothetical protein